METKICIGCNQALSLELFSFKNKQKGQLQSRCKKCYNAYNRDYYKSGEKLKQKVRVRNNTQAIRSKYNDWKRSQCCCVCGEDASECLDLHHLDPNTKEGSMSEIVLRGSWKRVLEEIYKCIVVCSNCHRKIHSGRIQCPVSSVEQSSELLPRRSTVRIGYGAPFFTDMG